MKKTAWLLALVIPAIVVVAGFQVYWLADNYQREKKTLDIKTNTVFGDMIREMRDSTIQAKIREIFLDTTRVKLHRLDSVSVAPKKLITTDARITRLAAVVSRKHPEDSIKVNLSGRSGVIVTFNKTGTLDSLRATLPLDSINPADIKRIIVRAQPSPELIARTIDSLKGQGQVILTTRKNDSARKITKAAPGPRVMVRPTKISYRDSSAGGTIRIDSLLYDTLPVNIINQRFAYKLDSMQTAVPFSVLYKKDSTIPGNVPVYELSLGNTTPYLLKKLSLPIIFSLGLITITLLSFFLLYTGLKRQQRLAAIKQEFISNITHELKTPIATVGVAIEALRNFNALNDPARTREYLDISKNELQRLSLLVDKVLKLSMFENKEIEMRPELVNLEELCEEVAASMRLQLEKQQASLTIDTKGDCILTGDKLHLQSLVFNLVDNALKYSSSQPSIHIKLEGSAAALRMDISDNGIGIPPEYRQKVFEKFFRVPHGDTHNAKGHGLGLSYVAQVVARHNGAINIEPVEGGGTRFIILLPK